jgi:hypothetical protein
MLINNLKIIGRWADVKESLDTLVAKAMAIFIKQSVSSCEQTIRENKRMIEDINFRADQEFGTAMPATDLPF